MKVGPLPFHEYLILAVATTALVGIIPILLRAKGRTLLFCVPVGLATLVFFLQPFSPLSFAGIHVLYGVFTWSIPAVGLTLIVTALFKRSGIQPRHAIALGAVLLLPGFLGFYATNIEPKMLEVDDFTIQKDTPTSERLKIVVVSDIQSPSVGAFERKVARTVTQQQADIILFPGDLYSGEDEPFPQHFDEFTDLVSNLDAEFGTYFVPGDHDGDDTLPAIVEASGKTFLQEHLQVVQVRNARIGILGIDTDYSSKSANALLAELAENDELDFKIVVSHKPDVIFNTPSGIDLVVAGHTHGGQVQIPFLGPVITLSDIPRRQAAGGLFDYSGGRKLFVTRGIGVEHGEAPLVRFNDKPQIAVLDVTL